MSSQKYVDPMVTKYKLKIYIKIIYDPCLQPAIPFEIFMDNVRFNWTHMILNAQMILTIGAL